ncbi:replication protein [Paenibacillus humicus]|uniref:replication protein n=1 Tax=Paenibacillus humicus TaxID=412861 RepID=UPI000FDA4EED|nr:replication protein [Paenibacillus humicus]
MSDDIQKENGYTPIAHVILEQASQHAFNGAQSRLLMRIWRLTYGYNRKDHEFSISYLKKATGLSERTVKKELAALIKANVLIVTKHETRTTARKLAFNKRYKQWTIQKDGGDQVEELNFDEGNDTAPHQDESSYFEGKYTAPPEGNDTAPQVATLRGTILPLNKDILLKKVFKENVDPFTLFYETYPRRISKAAALKAWKKLQKEPDFDPIIVILHTQNFAETHKLLKTQTSYIPHPSTYLNQKRFEDYSVVDPEGLLQQLPAAPARQSKLSKNKDRLMGGVSHDRARSEIHPVQGISSLPEPAGVGRRDDRGLD